VPVPVPDLSPGERRYHDDDGAADPRVAVALTAFAAGEDSEHAVLTALAAARLLVPLVAALADGEPPGTRPSGSGPAGTRPAGTGPAGISQAGTSPVSADPAGTGPEARDPEGVGAKVSGAKVSEIALPTLVGRDGRTALPVFTSLDALTRWRPGARPVPREAGLVWRAADRDGHAVMVDVAGPVPLPVEGARLAALARGEPVPPAHRDPDTQAAIAAVAARHPAVAGVALYPGQAGTDLLLQLRLAPGIDDAAGGAAAARLGEDVMAALGSRLRRGISVAVTRS
jgi:hypothetical protein